MNKARPEVTIAEGCIINDTLTFSSMNFHGLETRYTRPNDDGQNVTQVDELSVFSQRVQPVGGRSICTLPDELLWKTKWYVLNNCHEI